MIRTCRIYQVADHSAERELDHSSGAGTFTSANTGRSLEVHSEKHRHRNADKSLGDSGFGAVLRNKSIAKAPRRFANDTRDSDLCVVKMQRAELPFKQLPSSYNDDEGLRLGDPAFSEVVDDMRARLYELMNPYGLKTQKSSIWPSCNVHNLGVTSLLPSG